ncbi:hypothetical protein F4809DRAFT_656629 [Biscogniauxia mediterranea]|nr:hypothetical protein F4809DRAFT_656629 [Biscogniauxia mediterranea]
MSPSPDLGLSCPFGGDFYVCGNSTNRFIGCCEHSPCTSDILPSALNNTNFGTSGLCPIDSLKPASFAASAYDDIPPQACTAPPSRENGSSPTPLWYTCAGTRPPCLGCYTKNPCGEDHLESWLVEHLVPAVLSDDATDAAVFLGTDAENGEGQDPGPAGGGDGGGGGGGGDQAPAAGDQPGTSNRRYLGIELTIGISALVVLLAIVGWLVCRRRRDKKRQRQQRQQQQQENPEGQDDLGMNLEPLRKPEQPAPSPALPPNRYSDLTTRCGTGSSDCPRTPPPRPSSPPKRSRPRPYSGPTSMENMAKWTLRPDT